MNTSKRLELVKPAVDFPAGQLQPDAWVLLWSHSANALHVEKLDDMLRSNARAYRENRRMDYVPLVVGARELVESTADAIRQTLADRAASSVLHYIN